MGQIADDVALAALETVLKSLGTSIKHYMPVHKAAAIEAMRGVLMAERERAACLADDHGGEDGTGPDCQGCGELIAERIRRGAA